MASTITSPESATEAKGAIGALTEPLDGRWPHRFAFRGREYVQSGGCVSFSDDEKGPYMTLKVCPEGRPERKLTVHDSDKIRVLSYAGCWDYVEVFV
jgi:hypothetical protein